MMYLAFSYNYASDRAFVGWLARQLSRRGIKTWYLADFNAEEMANCIDESERDTRYSKDWRLKPENWHATYLRTAQRAQGAILVTSPGAVGSLASTGRGMWLEQESIDYIFAERTKSVINPYPLSAISTQLDSDSALRKAVGELVDWGDSLFSSPLDYKPAFNPAQCSTFNIKTNEPAGINYPTLIMKTSALYWCEVVRLDLYDVQWFCRRCAAESENFIYGPEEPPHRCPACGFKGYNPPLNRWRSKIRVLDDNGEPLGMDLYREIAKKTVQMTKLGDETLAELKSGNFTRARELTLVLETSCRELGLDEAFCDYLKRQLDILQPSGHVDEFERALSTAEAVFREINYHSGLSNILPHRARLMAQRGDHRGSLLLLREAEQMCRDGRDLGTLSSLLRAAISDLIAMNDRPSALKNVRGLQSICLLLNDQDGFAAASRLEHDIGFSS
jgi:hypothetical protein